jgi:hypothetical protein
LAWATRAWPALIRLPSSCMREAWSERSIIIWLAAAWSAGAG